MVKLNDVSWVINGGIRRSRLLNPKIGKHSSPPGSRVQSRF